MCGVIGRDGDGEQRLPEPVYTVIPVSRDRLPLAELGRRHHGQQGQGPAFQGPLPDLGLHHPPCRSHAAQQGFSLGGQIAQLRLLPYQVLPSEARQHGLRPLIRYCVGSVGRLTRSARRLRLLFSKSNLRLDWLLPTAQAIRPRNPHLWKLSGNLDSRGCEALCPQPQRPSQVAPGAPSAPSYADRLRDPGRFHHACTRAGHS